MHTQRTLAARTLCAHSTVSWHTRRRFMAPSGRVVGRVLLCRRTHELVGEPCRSFWAYRVAAPPPPPPPPVKTQNLCHDTTNVTCCVERVAARVVAFLCRVTGRCCAVSQPLAHYVVTPCMLLLSRYNHLYRDTPQRPRHARAWASWPCHEVVS